MAGMHKTMKSIEAEFKEKLKKRGLKQTTTDKCNVMVVFCPIVSRAGTDISAALSQLVNVFQLVILVVLHHTFDPDKTIPDSNAAVNREDTFAVDFLFYEDTGLLQCQKNEEAFETFAKYLKSQNITSYAYFNDIHTIPDEYTDDEERRLITPEQSTTQRWKCTKTDWLIVGLLLLLLFVLLWKCTNTVWLVLGLLLLLLFVVLYLYLRKQPGTM
ncbi:uncharacterized protein [Paramisgurnus dabryanus]|uniref:uncharacterized protein n=1 Tax=Paramisgurnus dabryanus TaxID=90735 RepID=UPI0031F33DE5